MLFDLFSDPSVLVGAGDVIAQQAVERKGLKHDVLRTVKMTGMGLCIIGPGLRTWYIILEKLVKGAGKTVALKKMLLDQTVWAPSFLAMFLSAVSVLNGKSKDEIIMKFQNEYIDMMKVNYMIWPAVQLLNFYFVPMQHRVVVVNFVALFWNTYLAFVSHRH
eukprot:gene8467-14457_t